MKKQLLTSLLAILCLLVSVTKSQTYSSWGKAINQTGHMYDSIANPGDSLKFQFLNTQTTAYGIPKLIVYYEGNFGDWFDYMELYDEQLNYTGATSPSSNFIDCSAEDSTVFTLTPSDINTWTANNSILFTLIPNSDNGPCSFGRVRAKLVYDYCLAGLPVQMASVSIANSALCSTSGPNTLTGIPAGGTFSGPGISGSTFNPAGLAAGNYQIAYTVTDAQNCILKSSLTVFIKPSPKVNNNATLYACNGSTFALHGAFGSSPLTWYSDAGLTTTVSTANNFTTPALAQTTNYWVTALDQTNSFTLNSVVSTGTAIVDINTLAGDDRGGIAVTQNYVYMNGDNHCVRYDVNLTPGSGISLPIRDGMFSDLRTGKLWTLWNSTLNIAPGNSNTFNADAFRGLDSALNFTSDFIPFSQVIQMGNNNQQCGIFSGAGIMGMYSGDTQHWYVVDMDNGTVSDLGYLNSPQFYGSENWSDWGVIESDCNGSAYSVIYRDGNDDDIHRRVLPNGPVTSIGSFSDLSDMASLAYSPWNNRWYWHFEGSSSTFGGSAESLGYANATGAVILCPGNGVSCPTKVTVNVPANVTLSVSSTALCLDNSAVALAGGSPSGGTYSGIGVGTNASGTVFFPALAGVGSHTIIYTHIDAASGCVDSDAKVISVDQCTGLSKQSFAGSVSIYPNPGEGIFYYTIGTSVISLKIDIIDIQGRQVGSFTENAVNSGTVKAMDLSHLPSGMYFVKMNDGNTQHMQRIVVQH